MKKKFRLKQDKYRKSRGDYARFLNIYCSHCRHPILLYQKDGPGILKRLYIDRIFAPEKLSSLQKLSIKRIPNLICKSCKSIVGTPMIYKKENRKAFYLFQNSITKRLSKGIYHSGK